MDVIKTVQVAGFKTKNMPFASNALARQFSLLKKTILISPQFDYFPESDRKNE